MMSQPMKVILGYSFVVHFCWGLFSEIKKELQLASVKGTSCKGGKDKIFLDGIDVLKLFVANMILQY
jgi:hypothetical protein